MKYRSPAKINLDLRILKKREDGFHEMTTVMAPLELADTMTFEKADSYQLFCDFPGVPPDETNLVSKAVRLLEQKTQRTFTYHIHLEKVIPHGAGLAGGSSNAATTLLALNELEQLELTKDQLAELAAGIGSDVSFFIYESIAQCRGRGELVEPVDLSFEANVLLVKPSFGVSTPQAYKAWKDSSKIKGISYAEQEYRGLKMANDLERPVFQKHRFLAELKMWLLDQPEVEVAMMSGSGSTVFAIVNGGAAKFNEGLKMLDPNLWICETKLLPGNAEP